MSVMSSADDSPPERRHPLAQGASPEAIAAALLPGDRVEFLTEYTTALNAARESLDLSGLVRTQEHWRRVAALQSDPQMFRRVARRAAELLNRQKAGGS